LIWGPTTDSTYSTGYVGITVFVDTGVTTDMAIDNFEGGDTNSGITVVRSSYIGNALHAMRRNGRLLEFDKMVVWMVYSVAHLFSDVQRRERNRQIRHQQAE
jgi:hypothetical protein